MQATQVLPKDYQSIGSFDLRNNTQAMIQLNMWGLVLFVISAVGFTSLLVVLRPAEMNSGVGGLFFDLNTGLMLALVMLLLTALMIVLHEAAHGIFFWIYTRAMPKFAFRGVYAYAAAPDWYLPKNQYLVTALAPLVLLSLLGIAIMAVIPAEGFLGLLFFLVSNASGAVGDLWVVVWLLRQPANCYANDQGDAVTLYVKGTMKNDETAESTSE